MFVLRSVRGQRERERERERESLLYVEDLNFGCCNGSGIEMENPHYLKP